MRVGLMFACSSTNQHLIPVYAHWVQSKNHSNSSTHSSILMDLAFFFPFFKMKIDVRITYNLMPTAHLALHMAASHSLCRGGSGVRGLQTARTDRGLSLHFQLYTHSVSMGSNMCLLKLQELFLHPWTMLHPTPPLDFFSSWSLFCLYSFFLNTKR